MPPKLTYNGDDEGKKKSADFLNDRNFELFFLIMLRGIIGISFASR